MNAKKGVTVLLNLFCVLLLVFASILPCSAARGECASSEQSGIISLDYNSDYGYSIADPYSMLFGSEKMSDAADDSFIGDLYAYEDLLSDFSFSNLMNTLIEAMDDTAITYFAIMLIIAYLGCFLGYRLYPLFLAMASVGLSLLGGSIVTSATESTFWFWLFLAVGIIFAVLFIKFKSLGAFFIGLVHCWFVPTLIAMALTESFKNGLIIGTIIAVICGIITAIFKKPIIIVGSVLHYGSIAGFALACLIAKIQWSVPFQILFVIAGFLVQIKTNNGLLERGPLIRYLKNKFASKPKVEADALEWTMSASPVDTTLPEAGTSSEHIASASAVQVCPHCDTRNHVDDAFCYCCGNPLRVKDKSDAAEQTIPTPPPVNATVPEVPIFAEEKKAEASASCLASAATAIPASSERLKFHGFSAERSDASGSVVIKMGDKVKPEIPKQEVASENRLAGLFVTTNDFDDE